MLHILRTQPEHSAVTSFMDASVTLRDENNQNIDGYPDISFVIRTYQKIAKDEEEITSNSIIRNINLFFDTLDIKAQTELYKMYKYAKAQLGLMDLVNRREIQDNIQEYIFKTIKRFKIDQKMIDFCGSPIFVYPDLAEVGTLPHHMPAKTFVIGEYIEITAISLLSKMMIPIWGELIKILGDLKIGSNNRDKIAFELIEPVLEDGPFERIYAKLSYYLSTSVIDTRKALDGKATANYTTSSFIITHNGIDDEMFNVIVMAAIVVKRMATYDCFTTLRDGGIPDAMVYINDGIKRTANTRIQAMRETMNTMPRKPLPSHDTEDNQSILDHASKMSKKPIDVPIVVVTAAEQWEIPKLVELTETPLDVYQSAIDYYRTNTFDVSPLCQAMVASFVGTRFGGSKCINYLPPQSYHKVVVLLQVFLIRNGMFELASLISSKTSTLPIDGTISSVGVRIQTNLNTTQEFHQCLRLFKGFLRKPVNTFGKKGKSRKGDPVETVSFTTHINRLTEWVVRYTHAENMAPALWEFSKQEPRTPIGAEVVYSDSVIRTLCRFYLLLHDGKRPF
jgi:hypothetical protein